jgi:hypothetical protein
MPLSELNKPINDFSVSDVLSRATTWDKRIAADLIAEMEIHLSEKVTTLNLLQISGHL